MTVLIKAVFGVPKPQENVRKMRTGRLDAPSKNP